MAMSGQIRFQSPGALKRQPQLLPVFKGVIMVLDVPGFFAARGLLFPCENTQVDVCHVRPPLALDAGQTSGKG